MTKLTPENIRSEVIQTTCSASKKLTPAFAIFFSKVKHLKYEQNLFIQSAMKKNSTVPQGCRTASIKNPRASACKKDIFPPMFFLF